jgi:hypothetical protein
VASIHGEAVNNSLCDQLDGVLVLQLAFEPCCGNTDAAVVSVVWCLAWEGVAVGVGVVFVGKDKDIASACIF